jgi:hypothetical protein
MYWLMYLPASRRNNFQAGYIPAFFLDFTFLFLSITKMVKRCFDIYKNIKNLPGWDRFFMPNL